MHRHRVIEALNRPAQELGVLPELTALRPQLAIHIYETLPSTNQQAWQLIHQGHRAGTVVIAQQQSAGRGQWGRTWLSNPGGLYLSLVLEPNIAIAQGVLLTLASAWGIATSFQNLAIPVQLKWPNDLVSNGRKVGGILTQVRLNKLSDSTPYSISPSARQNIHQAVVGVGINWDNPLPENAISVRKLLPDPARERVKSLEDVTAIALRGLLQGYYYWQQQGTTSLVEAYQQKLSCLGRKVDVDGHPGVVAGVSPEGDLTVAMVHNEQETVQYFKPGEISLGYNV
ncbi:biotin--[acetyl-CoA-carboxylase] ligase [Oscillatoria sp. CS-180]|uniref:biotin--[acetyl-CoA-carboxylase] ligase n=1 Tax=Oscillatoria sp. CS-180 TaxID=3021720 RepID=UPI00232E0474|nr:biotin--[acetyl-CoA-carboxylase] ligase [Oscillatoria sp. CS-180]MDB9528342.1 biotin--[acetyl-CoA-carboxylase] ligase [Oscillatoria sp. CS-180]